MTRQKNGSAGPDKHLYGALIRGDGVVVAWRESHSGTATTLPRVIHDARRAIPYSAVGGTVGSWLLWFDVLCDVCGDCMVAGRWAGLLEYDMSYVLRDLGRIELGGEHLLSWLGLVEMVDGAGGRR